MPNQMKSKRIAHSPRSKFRGVLNFGSKLLHAVFLPNSVSPSAAASATASAGNVFETAINSTSARTRPAAAQAATIASSSRSKFSLSAVITHLILP